MKKKRLKFIDTWSKPNQSLSKTHEFRIRQPALNDETIL